MKSLNKALLVVFVYVTIVSSEQPDPKNCYLHGEIVDGACVCYEGYDGDVCQHCVHRFLLNDTEGTVSDGPDVVHFSGCLAIIKPPTMPNATLHLEFVYLESECCLDYLNAYDGISVHDPLLATFSGRIFPTYPPSLVANSGSATLDFYNDHDPIRSMGYEIRYWLDDPTIAEGSGMDDNVSINCLTGWCLYQWPQMLDQGRASLAVASSNTSLYVYGGEMFGLVEFHKSMMRLDMETMEWSEVEVGVNQTSPSMRSSHSMVHYNGSLLVFGGKLENNEISNELLSYDLLSGLWENVDVAVPTTTVVPSLMGHTAHVASYNGSDVMLVFFGYSQQFGVSNLVFQYDLVNHSWSHVRTEGYYGIGSYGHASTIDIETNTVYLHGGYSDEVLTSLYKYDVDTRMWTSLPPSDSPRYLHSMVMLTGSLYTFGGLSRTTPPSCGCVDVQALRFNLECGEWQKVGEVPSYASPRYGHSALALNSSKMLVIGGFDGSMLGNVITFSPDKMVDDCTYLNKSQCADDGGCSWSKNKCLRSCQSNNTELPATFSTNQTFCSDMTSCKECLFNSSCCYIIDTCYPTSNNECTDQPRKCPEPPEVIYCRQQLSCHLCFQAGCLWNQSTCMPLNGDAPGNMTEVEVCEDESCTSFTDCYNCTTSYNKCGWCDTTGTCYKINEIPIEFPYGTCFHSTAVSDQCTDDPCTEYTSCDDCFKDARCGWCDLGTDTGRGLCMSGSLHGPQNITGYCPSEEWHFEECIACQCNGHSTCLPTSPDTCQSCEDGTAGSQCEECKPLWFGDSLNGDNCTECECNGHAFECMDTGYCNCYTTGVSGRNCQICQAGYVGDAENDTCFYPTQVMMSYRFSLYSNWVEYETTSINFEICPPHEADMKVGFVFNSSVNRNLTRIVITTNATNHEPGNETVMFVAVNVTENFQYYFEQSEYHFDNGKVCVRIYVSVIDVPVDLQMTIIQYFANIWMIVLIFVSCFLGLLIMAVIVWKINEVIVRHRRRARRAIELERMAARPIASVNFDTDVGDGTTQKKAALQQPDVLSEEACVCGEAAAYTVILSLPTSENSTFTGCSVALGTTLGTRLCFEFNSPAASDMKQREISKWQEVKMLFHSKPKHQHQMSFDNPVMDISEQI